MGSSDAPHVDLARRGQRADREFVDAVIARIAARQRGLISRRQLLDAGLTAAGIERRVKTGRLHLVHRGVYAVGHPALAPGARELAAVLACGPHAVVSHTSAAALWEILPAAGGPVHVTCRTHRRTRSGIVVHEAAIDRHATRILGGIPLTAPSRTLRDLAAVEGVDVVTRAAAEAQARRLVTAAQLANLGRSTGHPGAPALRAALGDGPALTRSEAERRLLSRLRDAGLPRPETNVRVGRHEVDALWREARLVVEVDGYAFHSSREAFERDRGRDADLLAAGHRVLRVTWRQLTERPEEVAGRIAAALAAR